MGNAGKILLRSYFKIFDKIFKNGNHFLLTLVIKYSISEKLNYILCEILQTNTTTFI